MARLVLSDTSHLIALSRVGGLGWARTLFGTIEITAAVWRELGVREQAEEAILRAVEQDWLVIREQRSEPDAPPHLGPGEWSSICAAVRHDGPVLLLMDDRLARREAQRRGLALAGTAALVGMAKRRGLVDSAQEVFEQLLRSGFRISPGIVSAVLESVES